MALPYQFRRDLVQTLERQIYGCEQFDKQVAAVFFKAARRAKKFEVFGPCQGGGMLGRFSAGLCVGADEIRPLTPTEIIVGRRDMYIERGTAIRLPQMGLPCGQKLRGGGTVLLCKGQQILQTVAVSVPGTWVPAVAYGTAQEF